MPTFHEDVWRLVHRLRHEYLQPDETQALRRVIGELERDAPRIRVRLRYPVKLEHTADQTIVTFFEGDHYLLPAVADEIRAQSPRAIVAFERLGVPDVGTDAPAGESTP